MKLLLTFKNTFINAYNNRNNAIKICSTWFVIMLLALTIVPQHTIFAFEDTVVNINDIVYMLLLVIAKTAVMYSFIRSEVLAEDAKLWQIKFGVGELKLLGFRILYPLCIVLFSLVAVFAVALPTKMINNDSLNAFMILFSIIVPIYFTILFSRLVIKFAAISVGDKDMSIKQAFLITKGNTWKIFLSQLFVSLPITIVSYVATLLFAAILAFSGEMISGFLINVLTLGFVFIDIIIISSLYAIIYKNFVNVVKVEAKEIAKTVEEKTEIAPVVKKAPAKKPAAKKASAPKKPVAKKAPAAKKPAVKKAPTVKKPAAKKAPAKKTTKK